MICKYRNAENDICSLHSDLTYPLWEYCVDGPCPDEVLVERLDGLKGGTSITKFDDFIENASRLTFEAYDDYTLEEMANRLSFKIFECRSVFRTLPRNTRMLYIIAYNETIHEIRRRNEK